MVAMSRSMTSAVDEVEVEAAALTSPQRLLSALQREAGRRLALSVGGVDRGAAAGGEPLLSHWLLPGGVVELQGLPGAGALGVALALARGARARAMALSARAPRGIGLVDGPGTTCAPALAHALDAAHDTRVLHETVVVRPAPRARAHDEVHELFALGLRLCRSGACCAVVVDVAWARALHGVVAAGRRLLRAAEETGACVIALTAPDVQRELPLPSSARATIERTDTGAVVVRAVRHRHGLPPPLVVSARRLGASVTDDVEDALRAPSIDRGDRDALVVAMDSGRALPGS